MPFDPALIESARTIVFDAYGTLFDVHSAVARHSAALGPEAARLSETWRAKQLEYSWVLSLAGRYEPFWALTEKALDYALARHPGADPSGRPRLLDAHCSPHASADVRPTLAGSRARGLCTGVL